MSTYSSLLLPRRRWSSYDYPTIRRLSDSVLILLLFFFSFQRLGHLSCVASVHAFLLFDLFDYLCIGVLHLKVIVVVYLHELPNGTSITVLFNHLSPIISSSFLTLLLLPLPAIVVEGLMSDVHLL